MQFHFYVRSSQSGDRCHFVDRLFFHVKEQNDRPFIGWQLGEGCIEHLYLVGAVCPAKRLGHFLFRYVVNNRFFDRQKLVFLFPGLRDSCVVGDPVDLGGETAFSFERREVFEYLHKHILRQLFRIFPVSDHL